MNYIAPEFELIIFNTNDIIADSQGLAITSGDNASEVPDEWWS